MVKTLKKAAVLFVGVLLVPNFVFAQGIPEAPAIPEPLEIRRSTEGGVPVLEKIYVLPNTQSGDAIPRADFEENEICFQFAGITAQDNSKEEVKAYSRQQTIHTDTDHTQSVVAKFAPAMEVSTEDGYAGVLNFDYTTLTVSAAGYGIETYQVNENRVYPNLVDADTSLVPKTISQDGNTLNLTGIQWQTSAAEHMDGQELAVRYTANATYIGTATRTYPTGYTATAYYTGEVQKITNETTMYTARFIGTPKPAPEPEPHKGFWSCWWIWLIGAAALGGGGYGAYRLIRKRKKGY